MSGPKKADFDNVRGKIKTTVNTFKQNVDLSMGRISQAAKQLELVKFDLDEADVRQYTFELQNAVTKLQSNMEAIRNIESQSAGHSDSGQLAYDNLKGLASQIEYMQVHNISTTIAYFEGLLTKVTSKQQQIVASAIEQLSEFFQSGTFDLIQKYEPDNSLYSQFSAIQTISNVASKSKAIKELQEKITTAITNAQGKAEAWELQKDTSQAIMESLTELGFVNIKRTVDNGIINISTTTPSEDWWCQFKIDQSGEMNLETPHNSTQCVGNLANLSKTLEGKGVQFQVRNMPKWNAVKQQQEIKQELTQTL